MCVCVIILSFKWKYYAIVFNEEVAKKSVEKRREERRKRSQEMKGRKREKRTSQEQKGDFY